MCGFVGFVGGTDNQSEVLTKMMDRIVHRGPDMGGQFIDGRVALGFRRLSILDLTEAGAQPMANEDGSVVIVFNGEIYNFQELRSELEAKGYKFHCGADTESLLHGYEEWGEAVLDRLRGMYAFVIWDKKKNKLLAPATSLASSRFTTIPWPMRVTALRACSLVPRSRASWTTRTSTRRSTKRLCVRT